MNLNLGTSSEPTRFGHEGNARRINCYLEVTGDHAKKGGVTYAINGMEPWAAIPGAGPVRAMLDLGSRLIVVAGRVIASVDAAGAVSILGGIPSDGIVTMDRNRRQPSPHVAICCDGLVMLESGGTVTQVGDPDLSTAMSVVELDGFMVYLDVTGKIVASELNDAGLIDGLSFAKAESNADDGVRIAKRGRDLVVFGAKSTEFWANNGGDPFPFGRVTAREFGCAAAGSVVTVGETLVFVDHRKHVRKLQGYDAAHISIPAVERALAAETDIGAVTACSWVESGHEMVAFSGADWTWVYDDTTKLWHERQSFKRNRWRVSCATTFQGMQLFGSAFAPAIYRGTDGGYEAGEQIVMTVQTPPVSTFPYGAVWDRLDIEAIPGVGLNEPFAHTSDPQLMLDISEDGGKSWGIQRQLPIGYQGNVLRRMQANRLGRGHPNGRTLRLSVSAAVVRGLVQADLTVRKA